KRTVPFAEKHGIMLGLHGHSNLSDPNQFATPDSFEQGLAMSKNYRNNLDIGHFSAAGFDSVAFIRKHHDRITNLHLKDRKNNDGPNMPFGLRMTWALAAQAPSGEISRVVADRWRALAPGVSISLTIPASNAARGALTSEARLMGLRTMPPRVYNL